MIKPCIKWVGGKSAFIRSYRHLFPERIEGVYHEPFLGSGAVLYALAPEKAIVGDASLPLILYHLGVCRQPHLVEEGLNDMSRSHAVDPKETFLQARKELNELIDHVRENGWDDRLEAACAARMIYINRNGFNGLWRVNRKGHCNVPWGKRTKPYVPDLQRIQAMAEYFGSSDLSIHHRSYSEALKDVRERDFVYFDPPYYPLVTDACYDGYTKDGFSRMDQAALGEMCREIDRRGATFIAHNHDVEDVRRIYEGFQFVNVITRRTVLRGDRRKPDPEVIITNMRAS